MLLSSSFTFSQSNLNAYVECPRRFQLRYVSEQAWPAVPCEPALHRERMLELGRRLHHLIRQHVSGLSADELARTAMEEDADLGRWWRNYLAHPLRDLPADRRAEVTLSMPMGGRRLLAKYDLLALDRDRAVIVDWKTERRRPSRDELLFKLQTRVYRYLLVEAGETLIGSRFAPEQVRMVYWFAETPAQPELLPYDDAQHAQDGRYLSGLTSEIEAEAIFPMTTDEARCGPCVYRSLCDRGAAAGTREDAGLDEELEIDLEEGNDSLTDTG